MNLFLLLNRKKDILTNMGNQSALTSIVWKKYILWRVKGAYQLLGYQQSLKYLLLCSAEERNSYKFGTT